MRAQARLFLVSLNPDGGFRFDGVSAEPDDFLEVNGLGPPVSLFLAWAAAERRPVTLVRPDEGGLLFGKAIERMEAA